MMDRRAFLQRLGSTTVLTLTPMTLGNRLAGAQEATILADLGLPELTVTVTDTEYQVSPATTTAGWTLITFENQGAGDNSADIMMLPPGETTESLLAAIATPTAAPPAWNYQTIFAGAPWAPAGAFAQAVVLLTAGDWVVFSPAPLTPASLTVSERDGTPAAPPELTADLEVTMSEFAFVGLEEPVPTGQQLWKVTNAGKQPHFITFSQLPPGATQVQYMDSLTAMMTGAPAAEGLDLANLAIVGGCSTLSTGQSLYLSFDLTAGTYGAICFFPDEETGAPHALMGMAQVFAVG
jgi:hypothetical protein